MPIELSKLQAVKTIVTHDNCADGLASAMILRDVLPKAQLLFLQYNSPDHLNLEATEGMLFCDFSPPAGRVEEFTKAGAVVLDHHKGAKDIVAAFGEFGVFADEKDDPGVSGAVLAFREVWLPLVHKGRIETLTEEQKFERLHIEDSIRSLMRSKQQELLNQGVGPDEVKTRLTSDKEVLELQQKLISKPAGPLYDRVTRLARLAGIRDTWQTSNPEWLDACYQHEALMFWPRELWLQAPIFVGDGSPGYDNRMNIGQTLFQQFQVRVQKAIEGSYRFEHNGTSVVVFAGTAYTSDAAEKLTNQADVVIGWSYFVESNGDMDGWPDKPTKGPKLVLSCRSRGKFDVLAFAKANGGGGHTKAAGFSLFVKPSDPNPYTFIEKVFRDYTPPNG